MPESRYLANALLEDAIRAGKMAFVSGPRQVGKTTLGRTLLRVPQNYWSWDDADFRRAWSKSPRQAIAGRGPGPILLDEIHKDRRWKSRLKGLYDTEGSGDGLIVTGSARLDLYRRGGDSLMGRYLPYRLHPFTVAERANPPGPAEVLLATRAHHDFADLLALGGFPEPFLGGSQAKARRWSRLRMERLIAEDVRDLRAVEDLSGLRTLADLLPERVGSPLSVNALREDVGAAYATVRSWIGVFESLYHVFMVRPYAKRVARALRNAPKLYLFDILGIPETRSGPRLENLTALHLLKACHYWTDVALGEFELRYVRDRERREVDFLVLRDGLPWILVECKSNEIEPSAELDRFRRLLGVDRGYQLVTRSGYDRDYPALGIRVMSYERFLAGWI